MAQAKRDQRGICRVVQRQAVLQPELTNPRPPQSARVPRSAEGLCEVPHQGADVATLPALHSELQHRWLESQQLQGQHLDLPRRPLNGLPRPGVVVEAAATDLEGRMHRQDLLDGTSELRQALLHGQARHMVEGCRDDNLAVGILGVRLHTQHYLGLVGLAARQERLQHPRARTDPDGQHANCEGIQGAAMADLHVRGPQDLAQGPLHSCNHVCRSYACRLVDANHTTLKQRRQHILRAALPLLHSYLRHSAGEASVQPQLPSPRERFRWRGRGSG
mmetsp:Transcript_114502/g.363917  ORF Transcript_114502/g.363917 Transcript_114502/m.363917 type:complete len:276 (+) Transcript_114502:561-1388(+)